MFVYLSKKIAIPNGTRLHTVAWNPDQGWIACGGASGLMKVLKLESISVRGALGSTNSAANGTGGAAGANSAANGANAAGGSNLSMNQTLEGHNGAVVCVTWNAAYSKLTTADENGLIIVWMLHKAMWFEEMINNRNRSVVRDMRWSGDGQRICIVYADGAVIVGGVDGNRLWGKDLDQPLQAVQWSPDGRYILFTTEQGNVQLYSSGGDHIRRLRLPALEQSSGDGKPIARRNSLRGNGRNNSSKRNDSDDDDEEEEAPPAEANDSAAGAARVIAMDWYDGAEGLLHEDAPTLCVALSDGRAQLSRGVDDACPIVLDPAMRLKHCKWNTNGTVLALCGTAPASSSSRANTGGDAGEGGSANKEVAVVKFYSPFGRFLTLLKVPGPGVASMAWEGGGLRLALAVDAFIYFANVRPEHRFGLMPLANTLAFAYQQADRRDARVCFWDFRTLERRTRPAKDLRLLLAAGEHAALVTGNDPNPSPAPPAGGAKANAAAAAGGSVVGGHSVTLCNAVGAELDCRAIEVEPVFGAMTATHVAVADRRYVHVWQYVSSLTSAAAGKGGASDAAVGVAQALKRAAGAGAGRERVLDPQDDASPPMTTDAFRAALAAATNANKNPSNGPAPMGNLLAAPAWGKAGRLEGVGGGAGSGGAVIAALGAAEGFLVVGLEDGTLLRYVLPHLACEGRAKGRPRPRRIAVGSGGLRVATVDAGGVATVVEFEVESHLRPHFDVVSGGGGGSEAKAGGEEKEGGGARGSKWLNWERKDAWEVMWSEDDAASLCVMEKTRLVVACEGVAEEPVACSGYPCRFRGLEVTAALIDEIMSTPEAPDRDLLRTVETAPLRQLRETAATAGISEAYAQLSQQQGGKNSGTSSSSGSSGGQRRLWRVLAEAALEALEFDVAEKAFVLSESVTNGSPNPSSSDGDGSAYAGVRLTKRLRLLADRLKQKAEVAAFFGRLDEAETLYRDMDRRDLAVALRQRQNDHFRVVQLVKQGGGGDRELSTAWANIATHYLDRCRWAKAAQYFDQVRDVERACDCHFRAGDYPRLRDAAAAAPEGSPLLTTLGKLFEAVGMADDAVSAHLKAGDPKAAVDACVVLGQWDRALELAAEYEWPQVEGLLAREASRLLAKGDKLQAVELYRRANKPAEAALLLAKLAEECGKRRADPLRAKKLHILAALEVERHRKKAMDQVVTTLATRAGTGSARTAAATRNLAASTAATLHTLMAPVEQDSEGLNGGASSTSKSSSAVLDSAWRGAEAYHFYMMAQRQLYAGEADAAMRTAIRCSEYEDILEPHAVYSLVALAAYRCGYFGVCSRAFVKLETLPSMPEDDADDIQSLALGIFTRHQPQDPEPLPVQYLECLDKGTPYQACVATGQAIGSKARATMCRRCRHFAVESRLARLQTCPFCHASLQS